MPRFTDVISKIIKALIVSAVSFNLACSSETSSSTPQTKAEDDYCATVMTYSDGVTVTGTASYSYRPVTGAGLGAPLTRPIRYAEVSVKDSSGNLVQCSETGSDGSLSMALPANKTNLVIAVNSRILGPHGRASILTNPTDNAFYTLTKTISTASVDLDLGQFLAAVDSPGGAYNILDQIVKATDFLVTNLDSTNCTTYGCSVFANDKKVQVYWTIGKNPAEYFNSNSSLSFYVPGTQKLYILGGLNGNYTTWDTDHYDNSVILHEYGHFIEDSYSKSDSPGGTHSANGTIDARLAWGEGWANYFQGEVLGLPYYLDTRGTPEGSTSLLISLSLENQDANDAPAEPGEGNFREFSISRFLWDITDDNSETGDDVNAAPFAELWTIVNGSTYRSSSTYFRNIGLFHELHSALSTKADLSSLYTLHMHDNDQGEYGVPLTASSCSRDLGTNDAKMDPYSLTYDSTFSNHFSANDFFRYYHNGGNLQVRIDYTTDSSYPVDLDLYVYKDGYTYQDANDVVAYSETFHTPGSSTGQEIASASLNAGMYMINVSQYEMVQNASNTTMKATYQLTINGVQKCPSY